MWAILIEIYFKPERGLHINIMWWLKYNYVVHKQPSSWSISVLLKFSSCNFPRLKGKYRDEDGFALLPYVIHRRSKAFCKWKLVAL